MADYKDMLGSLMGKAKELAESDAVRGAMDRLSGSGVMNIYAQGADRAKTYARITRLSLEQNSANSELGRVYAEIGRLYYEQNREQPEGYFAPLFAQADELTASIHAKEDEIAALKASVGEAKREQDIEVEITDFEDIVNATEQDGAGKE